MKIIMGGAGSGKTTKLVECAIEEVRSGYKVHMVTGEYSPLGMYKKFEQEGVLREEEMKDITVSQVQSFGEVLKVMADNCDNSVAFLIDHIPGKKPSNYLTVLNVLEFYSVGRTYVAVQANRTPDKEVEILDLLDFLEVR